MYVVLDFETTGLDFRTEQVTEIGAVKLDENFNEVGSFHTFVQTTKGRKPHPVSGITEEMTANGMPEGKAFSFLAQFIADATVVAQYAPFDLAFLAQHYLNPRKFICTKSMTSKVEPELSSSLGPTCERLGIDLKNAHRALDDARATAQVLKHRVQVDGLTNFENVLVVTEGRPLAFIPRATEYIFTKSGDLIARLY